MLLKIYIGIILFGIRTRQLMTILVLILNNESNITFFIENQYFTKSLI